MAAAKSIRAIGGPAKRALPALKRGVWARKIDEAHRIE